MSCPARAVHPRRRPLLGRARTHHVFDQQVSRGEGNRVGGRRDGEHEGVGAADRARDHQIEGVHSQADGLGRGGGRPPQETGRSDNDRWSRSEVTADKTQEETQRQRRRDRGWHRDRGWCRVTAADEKAGLEGREGKYGPTRRSTHRRRDRQGEKLNQRTRGEDIPKVSDIPGPHRVFAGEDGLGRFL